MRKFVRLLVFIATATLNGGVTAEEINFELYALGVDGRVQIAKGTKVYGDNNFLVRTEERESRFYAVRKELELADGYSIGYMEQLEPEVVSLGLWVGHLPVGSNPNDFSWEWFAQSGPGRYRKLQGGAHIEVTFVGLPVVREIRTIRFLEDVEFDYTKDLCCKSNGNKHSHLLIIKAGSVLELPQRHDS